MVHRQGDRYKYSYNKKYFWVISMFSSRWIIIIIIIWTFSFYFNPNMSKDGSNVTATNWVLTLLCSSQSKFQSRYAQYRWLEATNCSWVVIITDTGRLWRTLYELRSIHLSDRHWINYIQKDKEDAENDVTYLSRIRVVTLKCKKSLYVSCAPSMSATAVDLDVNNNNNKKKKMF